MKNLTPVISSGCWSYIVNENGNAIRITLKGHGSCTPKPVLQKMIDELTPENFENLWQECEKTKDIRD